MTNYEYSAVLEASLDEYEFGPDKCQVAQDVIILFHFFRKEESGHWVKINGLEKLVKKVQLDMRQRIERRKERFAMEAR